MDFATEFCDLSFEGGDFFQEIRFVDRGTFDPLFPLRRAFLAATVLPLLCQRERRADAGTEFESA